MQLNENVEENEVLPTDQHIQESRATPETVPAPGIELPGLPTAKQPRNQHLKVDQPKNKQFTARCTEAEAQKINAAMVANGKTDIVRLMLYAMDLFGNDFFTSFKFK